MSTPKFSLQPKYQSKAADLLLLLYSDKNTPLFSVSQIPPTVAKLLKAPTEPGSKAILFRGDVSGKPLLAVAGRLDEPFSNARLEAKRAIVLAFSAAKAEDCKRIVVPLKKGQRDFVSACHEGALLGGYRYDAYLSKKPKLPEVMVVAPDATEFRSQLLERETLYECVNFARDVLNEPPNDLKPPQLAVKYEKFGAACGLKVEVWDENRLKKERCGGVLAVGMGSDAKPRMVIAEYKPAGAKKHLCLVGKGMTFDTGGYGLKTVEHQIGMKYDMGGAAMMFASACAIAKLKLPIRVTCLTPLAENMISGSAYHNTSVLRTRSGKTVEVLHTDAEGRLILADALALAEERKPDWIVDAATLTGATVIALGEDIAGVYGNAPELIEAVIETGKAEDELYWELPLHRPYAEKLKTTIADIKNRGDRWGGGITAALVLKEFVTDAAKWVHIDIAGPGCKEDPLFHLGRGAKGFGVKSMVALARTLSGN